MPVASRSAVARSGTIGRLDVQLFHQFDERGPAQLGEFCQMGHPLSIKVFDVFCELQEFGVFFWGEDFCSPLCYECIVAVLDFGDYALVNFLQQFSFSE